MSFSPATIRISTGDERPTLDRTPLREKHKPLAPGKGRAVSSSWYHPCSPRPHGSRPFPVPRESCHRDLVTEVGRRRLLLHGSDPRVSGRSSEVLFAGGVVPLLSCRGSLYQPDRLLVLIIAMNLFICCRAICNKPRRRSQHCLLNPRYSTTPLARVRRTQRCNRSGCTMSSGDAPLVAGVHSSRSVSLSHSQLLDCAW